MGRNSYTTPGTSFKTVTCVQCKNEVSRRSSVAIDVLADGHPTGRTEYIKRLWLSKERGKREITRKNPFPRICKGGCNA